MRECGGCTLCCKIPKITDLQKPSNTWCRHCAIGEGCTIYSMRPKVCKDFECWWLSHEEMPEELRPDRVHSYVVGDGDVLTMRVDPEFDWQGSPVLEYFKGRNILVSSGNQITFLKGLWPPEKLTVEWTL